MTGPSTTTPAEPADTPDTSTTPSNTLTAGELHGLSYNDLAALAAKGDKGAIAEKATRDGENATEATDTADATDTPAPSTTPAGTLTAGELHNLSYNDLAALAAKGDKGAIAEKAARDAQANIQVTTEQPTNDYQNMLYSQLADLAAKGDKAAAEEVAKRDAKSAENEKNQDTTPAPVEDKDLTAGEIANLSMNQLLDKYTKAVQGGNTELADRLAAEITDRGGSVPKVDNGTTDTGSGETDNGGTDTGSGDTGNGGTDTGSGDTGNGGTDTGSDDTGNGVNDSGSGDTDNDTTSDSSDKTDDGSDTNGNGAGKNDNDSQVTDKINAPGSNNVTSKSTLPKTGNNNNVVAASVGAVAVLGALIGLAGDRRRRA